MSGFRSHPIPALTGQIPENPWESIRGLSVDQYLWLDNGYAPEVQVKLYYTAERLHIQYRVFEENPTVRCLRANGPVYRDSCVEFFVQPLPESDPRYLNFELNAAGTLLLELGDSRQGRTPVAVEQPSRHFGICPSAGYSDPVSGRKYWELEFSVPFAWMQTLFPDFRPGPGCTLRGNFYKCGDDTPVPHFGVWNRVTSAVPDFHRSGDFGQLVMA